MPDWFDFVKLSSVSENIMHTRNYPSFLLDSEGKSFFSLPIQKSNTFWQCQRLRDEKLTHSCDLFTQLERATLSASLLVAGIQLWVVAREA